MNDSFDLAAEVRDLAARRDIYEAVYNYIRGQDRLLPEVQREAFHSASRVDCGLFSGTGYEWVDWAQKVLGEMQGSQHVLGQVQIKVNGDTADGEVYFIAWHRIVEDGVEKDWIFGGRYIDRYERRDGHGGLRAAGNWLIGFTRRTLPIDGCGKTLAFSVVHADPPISAARATGHNTTNERAI